MHFYAQINEDGICTSVTRSQEPLVGDQFIPLEFFDASVHGMRWTGSEWVSAD